MPRIIVVSDSHTLPPREIENIAECFGDLNAARLIHLGDGSKDAAHLQALMNIPMTSVAGNCDYSLGRLPTEVTLDAYGSKLLICHGHIQHVKLSLALLKLRAEEVAVNAALYGHTHIARIDYDNGILFLNPGSLRDDRYAILDIESGRIKPELRRL